MSGSILQALNRMPQGGGAITPSSNTLDQVRSMIGMVKNARNPQAMMMQLINRNPAMKQVMEIINQNSGDARKAFYAIAKENGVDPNEILRMLQ